MTNKMQAVVLYDITKAEDIQLIEMNIPAVKPGWVLIKVHGFGLNHSEQILRLNEIKANYIQKPIIPGIECVGEIVDASNSHMQAGQKVIAMMGGMGRIFNGSYVEYALLPINHVFPIESELEWKDLAAIPETYFTAWGSLFECLQLKKEDTLLIRGATCALGYASIQIAKAFGSKVIATTHRKEKLSLIEDTDEQILDDGILTNKVKGVTKALDLVGPKYLKDTMCAVEHGAIVCNTGILGGIYNLNNFDPIKDIPNGIYLTGFFSNYPKQEVIDEMFAFINQHKLIPMHGEIFEFKNIKEAIIAQDNGSVNGKIIVEVN